MLVLLVVVVAAVVVVLLLLLCRDLPLEREKGHSAEFAMAGQVSRSLSMDVVSVNVYSHFTNL